MRILVCLSLACLFAGCAAESDDDDDDGADAVAAIFNGDSAATASSHWMRFDLFTDLIEIHADGTGRFNSCCITNGLPATTTTFTWTQTSGDTILLSGATSDNGNTWSSIRDITGGVADASFSATVAINGGSGDPYTMSLQSGSF